MYGADVCAEARCIGVFGNGDGNLHVVGCATALELSACLGDFSYKMRSYGELPTFNMYSIRLPEWLSTMHSTQIKGLTCVFRR